MNEWINLNFVDLPSGFRMKFRKQSGTNKGKWHGWHTPNPSTNQWGRENYFCRQGAQNFPKCPAVAPVKHWLLPLAQFSLLPRKLSIVAATSTTCCENKSFLCMNSSLFKVYGCCWIPWMEEPGIQGSLGVGQDWATSLSLFTFMHWRRKWQPTPVFLPGESPGWGSLVGCCLWGCTELDTTEVT